MVWRILIGITLIAGLGSAVTEYDNIPLETSHAAQGRQLPQRPVYTATYGVAPGEYVLRSSDDGETRPTAPFHGFNFHQRNQPAPQEYLDLLRQAGAEEAEAPLQPHQQPQQQHHQNTAKSRVVDQQFFGVHSPAPYPASGNSPVSPLTLPTAPPQYSQTERAQVQTSRRPISSYPSPHNQVAPAKSASTPLYVTPLPDTVQTSPKQSKPTAAPSTRKSLGGRRTRPQGDSRQGSGKAVQLTYSLDYDLRTLHKEGESGGRPSSASAPFYPTVPGSVVKGDGALLRKLAPEPEPLPFPLSSRNNKKSKTKTSPSSDFEDDDQKIEVIKLPAPKNQRPITQEELNELIRAGYDISPADESEGQAYQPSQADAPSPSIQGYPRNTAPQHQLRLPKSRTVEAPPQAPRYYTPSKAQESKNNLQSNPRQNVYANGPVSSPSAEEIGYSYQTPQPLPLQTLRHKVNEPKVQAYQPGRSGIQEVNKQITGQQTYQEEEDQTQAYPGDYISHGYPTAAAPEQPLIPQVHNYPTAEPAQAQAPQQQYQRVAAEQAQLYHHQQLAQQDVQVYRHPGAAGGQNEALSQPKGYVIPAPQRPNEYVTRVNQGYVPTAPSAAGDEDTIPYHHALAQNQQQGYGGAPTAPGATASAGEVHRGLSQTTEGYGRRISRRRPSSHHESRVTYIRRYQGQETGYTTEQ